MTPLLRWAVPTLAKEKVKLDWDRAYTLWWGHVNVRGFRMQFDDTYTVQFDLAVERAKVVISLGSIPHRRFLLEHVRAHGVEFRLDAKVPPEAVRAFPRRVAAFPAVPGYPPVILEPATPKPPLSEARLKRLWAFELRDVTAVATEVWIDEFRYRGIIKAEGAFDLEPRRKLWVDAHASLQPGTVTAGPYSISHDFDADARVYIAPTVIDPQRPEWIAGATTAMVRADASLEGLELAALYFDRVTARPGSGRLSARVDLKEGRLTRDSALDLSLDRVDASVLGADVTGHVRVAARVDEEQQIVAEASAAADLVLPALAGVRVGAGTGPVHATVRLTSNDLAKGLGLEELRASAEHAIVDGPAVLARQSFVFSKLSFSEGPATAAVTAAVTPTQAWVRLLDARLGDAKAAGAAVFTNGEWQGAAQISVGRSVNVGVRLKGETLHPAVFLGEGWLEKQLRALGFEPWGS